MADGVRDDLAARLFETGWQSWSMRPSARKIHLPLFNYPPFPPESPLLPVRTPDAPLKQPARGWCSWYCFGSHINEGVILRQAEWFRANKLPGFQYMLIDDGWESQCGDWQMADISKFPAGLPAMAQAIANMGLSPGIWIAPFLVSPRSKLAREHPEWLARRGGRPIEGVRLTPFDAYLPYRKYVLDVTQAAVTDYIEDVLRYLLDDCGFRLIKLDFLYGLYNNPALTTHDSDRFLRAFLQKIKQRYPAVYTIACGCPLLPAIGAVDAMRVGPDTLWPAVQSIPFVRKALNRHCLRQVLHNIQSRGWTRQFWNLDYDAFVCRAETGVSDHRLLIQQSLIQQAGGNVFLGDDMTTLPRDRLQKFIQPLFR